MPKAHFKTAYLQREVPMDVKVAADLEVGDLVTLAEGSLSKKETGPAEAGDYIVAQSDMTMEYGHVPVEQQDWRYSPKVAASAEKEKKVALFRVNNPDDVIVEEDE